MTDSPSETGSASPDSNASVSALKSPTSPKPSDGAASPAAPSTQPPAKKSEAPRRRGKGKS